MCLSKLYLRRYALDAVRLASQLLHSRLLIQAGLYKLTNPVDP
jgi:hypothetical protein